MLLNLAWASKLKLTLVTKGFKWKSFIYYDCEGQNFYLF